MLMLVLVVFLARGFCVAGVTLVPGLLIFETSPTARERGRREMPRICIVSWEGEESISQFRKETVKRYAVVDFAAVGLTSSKALSPGTGLEKR